MRTLQSCKVGIQVFWWDGILIINFWSIHIHHHISMLRNLKFESMSKSNNLDIFQDSNTISFLQSHPKSCHRHEPIWDLPKDIFRVIASRHQYPPPRACFFRTLKFFDPFLASDTHHIELALYDMWVLWPLSCVRHPPPKICGLWLLSSWIPLLHDSLLQCFTKKGQINACL